MTLEQLAEMKARFDKAQRESWLPLTMSVNHSTMTELLRLAEIGMRVEALAYLSGANEYSEEFIYDSGFNACLKQLKGGE